MKVIFLTIFFCLSFFLHSEPYDCNIHLETQVKRIFEVKLNNDGNIENHERYIKQITRLGSNDVIVIEDQMFRIHKLLSSQGKFNQVFELLDGSVLRMTKVSKPYLINLRGAKSYVKGYEQLSGTGIRIPKILDYSQKGLWAKVEKIDIDPEVQTLSYYLSKSRVSTKKQKQKQVDEAFLRFAESTHEYKSLDDFHPDQIVYNLDSEWVLLDLGPQNYKFLENTGSALPGQTVFQNALYSKNDMFIKNSELIKKANEAILRKRYN